MDGSLDKILIIPSQTNYRNMVNEILRKKTPAGRFVSYDSEENKKVVEILRDVAEKGDRAVADYTKQFDGVDLSPEEFRIQENQLDSAYKSIDKALLESFKKAIENVRTYQSRIFIGDKIKHPGIRYTPIRRVGICVPGAAAPLPSTVIMSAVPAQVAGVKEIAVVSPPRYNNTIHPVILAVCHQLQITEVYRIGGVQAVAALAAGTKTIKKVDKIVGPGNKWVQSAKKNVSGDYVGIDSIAGPSEVLIIFDENANPAWVAADMLSQAEHASDSIAVAVTTSRQAAEQLIDKLHQQLNKLSRNEQALKSLTDFGAVVVIENIDELIAFANDFAAEHLEIQCGDKSRQIADRIENAGAIFIGGHTPVAVGDYWAGPSHTLPTGQTAKFSSALTSNDFLKSISIVEYSKEQLTQSADDIIQLARAEGLDAHAKSVQIRQQEKN